MSRSRTAPRTGPRSTTLQRVGSFAVRRRKAVLLLAAPLVVVFGVFGWSASRHLSQGGFDAPGSESGRAAAVLADQFHSGAPNLVLLVTARRGSVDSPPVAAAGSALARRLAAEPHVANVESYWS